MLRKKVALVTVAAMLANFTAIPMTVLADELQERSVVETTLSTEENNNLKEAIVTKFKLAGSEKLPGYDEIFKMDNSNIASVTNNGGNYGSSSISKVIDGDLNSHWETGKPNSADFKNEVVFNLNEATELNRIVYKSRPGNKGFAQEFEIYGSNTEEGDKFELVASGASDISGDLLEFKFDSTEFKRVKFVFTKANQNWAAASEFMFYKEDVVSDKMDRLFTDNTLSVVSEEFNTVDKINALDEEVKTHPLYEDFKEIIENAKIIIENKEVNYVDATVSTFKDFNSDILVKYDELYKIPSSKVTSITTNGGHYGSSSINKAMDEDVSTSWHSGKQNTSNFTNEVVIELDELTTLNRIVYTASRGTNRGFAEAFDIYASRTTKGDTFELISSGTSAKTQNSIEIRFNPTELKRVKFVFKQGYENWALAAEFGLYTQDQVSEKISRLFTDSSMSTVSEEFNTVDKINSLDEEAKNHPFYEEYKEDIENAIALVKQGQIEAVKAEINKFVPFYTEHINEYDEAFRIPSSKIQSLTNNGGQYAGSALKYAIDEDVNTHWETGNPNSDTFKNEVNLTLANAELINRVVYKSRNGAKGFSKNLSIYVSPTTKGDNFTKVTYGSYTVTSDLIEIQFDETSVKRLKFVFDEANDGWASIGDLRLYKTDNISDKMEILFTNGLMNEVSEEFNTIDKLDALEAEVVGHPLESIFKADINIARAIVNNEIDFEGRVIKVEQNGNMSAHANKNLKFGFGNDNQPTGISARPGEKIIVYVDVEDDAPLPSINFSQQEGSFANWSRGVSLHKGRNEIVVPEIYTDSWYKHDVTKGGPIYIVNTYTAEQQGKAPTIRFEGGDKFPILTADTNEEEFKAFLIEYKNRLDEDKAKNPDVNDRKVIDTFEFVSDHLVFTGTATGAYNAYINKGVKPLSTIESYNTYMKEIFRFYGLDGSSEKNDPKHIRENVRLAQPFGYMYAAGGHIGVQGDVMTSMLIPFEDRGPSWGLTHEIGHKMDVQPRLYGETTNNMLSMHMSVVQGSMDMRIPYESHVYKNVMKENLKSYDSQGYFEKLAVFWQLEMYKEGYWAELNQYYRERNVKVDSENTKMQYLVEFSSEILGLDLSEFFARHGFEVNDETRELVSKYPKPEGKLWYMNNSIVEYEGTGFNSNVQVEVSVATSKEENTNKLTFSIDSENKSDLLGYEIFRDGVLVGFTANSFFNDTDIDAGKHYDYKVVAHDKTLKTAEAVEVSTKSPVLTVETDVLLGLYEEFNPMDYASAKDNLGKDLIEKLTVVNSNVDTDKKGTYEAVVAIENNGITVEKTIKVTVVSETIYASDMQWKSSQAGYGSIRKDKTYAGNKILLFDGINKREYAKGIGMHATSEVTLDIEGKDFTTFETYVGADGNSTSGSTSVNFQVYVDGEMKYDSGVMKVTDAKKKISTPVAGAKEVKLVMADGGNGISNDSGVWADAKFTKGSSKPVITVEDKVYKIGEAIDYVSGVTAKDVEDGDLTSKVEIVSSSVEEGKVGRFEVVYSVTDSDGNTAQKTMYVTVYEDFAVTKSKFGEFDNLGGYNEMFKIPVVSVSNNGGRYGSSVIENSIDGNINTHWETGSPNNNSFKNEAIFDLGQVTEVDKIAYASRRGGKGFATKFEIYVSTEAEGNDFILAGKGSYTGGRNDVIEIDIAKTSARRVKFKFVDAYDSWASIGEISFYSEDKLADKIANELFTDDTKTEVAEAYNTLEKLEVLRNEVAAHPAAKLFESDLSKAEEIIRAKFPTLQVEGKDYIKLNSEYDVMSGVIANDQEDGDITNQVVAERGEFTTGKTGEYTITYTVTDSAGNIATAERKVVVYSGTEFVSNINWESARTDYGQVRKDLASGGAKIKVNVNGEEKVFDKGIGTHANSEIVYNLAGTNYEYFESYVGVDRNIAQQNNSSIIFQVFADGEKVYDSGLMKWADEAKLVRVALKGVNELKLVVNNGGNGNSSDHGDFADAKFLITNSKPTITIPSSANTKLGLAVDLNEQYSAVDAEDGDLTSKVVVEGEVNFNKAGIYKMTYSVTDNDGNTTSATREIKVVDMKDSTYLSDIDWKSANNSYGRATKDISASGKTLRLTDVDGNEVAYEKGIGTHSTSTIIYDLTDTAYGYLTSYVGVDRQMFGTVGSVTFQVWLDGTKVYDSGLMGSRDPQKFVEVNLAGAKEMKLVVTDGGNGNGSDHATFGDSKLHYANVKGVEVNKVQLDNLLAEIEEMKEANYSEESWNNLMSVKNKVIKSLADGYDQDEIDSLFKELNTAKEVLEVTVTYDELISLIETAKGLEEYLYTSESWKVLADSIVKAEAIVEEKSSTLDEVNIAVSEIQGAINNLMARQEKVELKELLAYADTITDISFVGAANHKETRWSNFQIYREVARESLLDSKKTQKDTKADIWSLNYFIEELQMK